MPLQAPNLDSRSFDEIYREARLRIPRYTPEWTDFNDSDPGITLLQLFAWLTESLFYQMNRVPERNYIKFLQMLGMELRPAQPATAYLTLTAQANADKVAPVPTGAQFLGENPNGGDPLIFEVEKGIGLVKAPLVAVQVFDGSTFLDQTPANNAVEEPFRPFGWTAQPGSALYLGFDPNITGKPFPTEITLRVFLKASALSGLPVTCRELGQPPAPSVRLIWEYRPGGTANWRRLNVFADESVAFTREGFIRIQGPADAGPSEEGQPKLNLIWIRSRLAEGGYPGGHVPEIDFVRPNVVEARNVATVRNEIVLSPDGQGSSGEPNQLFQLNRRPVVPDSLILEVESESGELETWERKDDFLCSGRDDAHYTLNNNTGEIRFGDGTYGRIPPANKQLLATFYRYGGGADGNAGAGAISVALTAISGLESVMNERPAVGGADEQKVEDLIEQAPRQLRNRGRAVTAEDFATIAGDSGGVTRAAAIALAHPSHPGVQVPGAVTVVVVPDSTDNPPKPSSELLQSVCRRLEEFRLITTELFVMGPTFIPVKVEATVEIGPYDAADAVVAEVSRAIDLYLSPLLPKGAPADAKPWPFGTDLVPTNLYSVIGRVSGVISVRALTLFVSGVATPLDQQVSLPADGLFYGAGHTIETTYRADLN